MNDSFNLINETTAAAPFVTILIPTFNCSQTISLTLDSVIQQKYSRYEILVIDGGSNDRTIEVLHSYHSHIRLCSAEKYDLYPILNQGIALAKGDYLNILFPGDFYIAPVTLEEMMKLAVENQLPDLVYCATLLRDGRAQTKFLYRPLTIQLLRNGQQPTSLQGCWFKREVLDRLAGFRTDFQLRGAFDLFCRFNILPSRSFVGLKRAYVDYDLRGVTSAMSFRHIWETAQLINAYFGKWSLMKWMVNQREIKRFASLWSKRLRMAFSERK